jgi:hypothetical protein
MADRGTGVTPSCRLPARFVLGPIPKAWDIPSSSPDRGRIKRHIRLKAALPARNVAANFARLFDTALRV